MDSSLDKPNFRFQKALDVSGALNNSTLGFSFNSSMKRAGEPLSRKTPSKTPRKSPGRLGGSKEGTPGRKTPGDRKSPGRLGGSKEGTPGRKTPGDRFIPNRTGMDFELAYHKLVRDSFNENDSEMMSPSKRDYQRVLQENLSIPDQSTTRILSYNNKPVSAPDEHANNLKVLYSAFKHPASTRKTSRHIPQAAERILDAPEILNDYYLNLVDWSRNNHLAVSLGNRIYLWNAVSGVITPLLELEGDDYVCSVRWISEGNFLGVGTSSGEVQLWDVEASKRLRVMAGHESRVSSLAWNEHILSSGARNGWIMHSDVRVADHAVSTSQTHAQEVCGLSWSPDGRYLASGGNDNLLCVWAATANQRYAAGTPHLRITDHQAAVRAVAWCPWQNNVLASGGGSNDRCIKIWNCDNGNNLHSLDTKSQVCSLVWNEQYKELGSSHGYPSHEINIWKYPNMTKVAELSGHTERVLQLAISPDTTTLLSAGADETLRLWKVWPFDAKKAAARTKQPFSALKMGIR